MIVTIDGYAGSGKSSAAGRLAGVLGFHLLNTGGMYRAAALALGRHGIDINAETRDIPAVTRIVESFAFEMPPGRVILNGDDTTDAIRTEDAGQGASRVGTFPEVRAKLKAEQRRIAAGRDIVCEGRDQGTAVFPDAPAKFFFHASAAVRADRRAAQLRDAGLPASSHSMSAVST
ncbi:MAG: (d)CMP kinase, partial [Fimbriiglobus sp.]